MNGEIPHNGRTLIYMATGLHCRCSECREWWRVYRADLRERHRGGPVPKPAHGLNGYQNYYCRCRVCSKASREREQARVVR